MGNTLYSLIFLYRLVAVDKSKTAHYDVIILDLDMPIMNGYQACKKILSNEKNEFKELFVIS